MRGGIRRRAALVAVSAVVLGAAGGAQAAPPADLPGHVPAAATDAPPSLPRPSRVAWPFGERFPQTSGTGRLSGGASLWSDFLFDDHGPALTSGLPLSVALASSVFAWWNGSYGYPSGPAHNDGADIFRAAVAVDREASYWRVDWATLTDPAIPIAAWVFDTDGDATTGVARWPAGAAIRSPGLERALVVSSRGAWLVDPGTGHRTDIAAHGGSLTVDRASQSFIVRIPRALLPVRGRWRVRLGAGLADRAGTAFAPAHLVGGLPAPPGAGRVYNVTFRRIEQEPPVHTEGMTDALTVAFQAALAGTPGAQQLGLDGAARAVTGNWWMEDGQADTLAGGDVSRFSRIIDWGTLAAREATPEPRPTGYSVRWYVSRFDLGGGMQTGESLTGAGSGELGSAIPTTLTRAQPYAVYVPTDATVSRPYPLTWMLHSLEGNYNQYGALDPQLIRQLCEERDSICVSPEGLGPAGGYSGPAETDFWQVWRSVADAYPLDTERTVLTGYSMGGEGTNRLSVAHPDLYAGAMVLDGSFSYRDLPNVRWIPFVIGNTIADELGPAPAAADQADRFDRLGLRYRLLLRVGTDHLVWATQDRFADAVAALGSPARVVDPARFDYTFRAATGEAENGTGTTGVYWLDGLAARNRGVPGVLSAVDGALPDPRVAGRRFGPVPVLAPVPGVDRGLTWDVGAPAPVRSELSLTLGNVARVSVDTRRARMWNGAITITTDGVTQLGLARLPRRARVAVSGARTLIADRAGRVTVALGAGTTTLTVTARRR